jgi:hypothetical protein
LSRTATTLRQQHANTAEPAQAARPAATAPCSRHRPQSEPRRNTPHAAAQCEKGGLEKITATLSSAGKMSFVVFDACRNVPLQRETKNLAFKGFAQR